MATLGGEPQPFPAAALAVGGGIGGGCGGCGGGGGGGGAGGVSLALQAPLSRGLERALEEAAHRGGLSLSGRKLKEFPRSAAALSHDLSDTVRAGEAGLWGAGGEGGPYVGRGAPATSLREVRGPTEVGDPM